MTKKSSYRTLADFPTVAKAKERLGELTAIHAKASATVRELELQLGPDSDESEVGQMAADLVSGAAAVAVARPDVLRALTAARTQTKATSRAVEMQRQGVRAAVSTAQKAIAKERRPGHVKAVERIDEALAALEAAIQEERAFMAQAVADGALAADFVKILLPADFGQQRPSNGGWTKIREWRQRLVRQGYLKGGQ